MTEPTIPLNSGDHNVGVKTSEISKGVKIIISLILIISIVLIVLGATGNLSGFEPGNFRTWSLLDPFNIYSESKPKKRVTVNTRGEPAGVEVTTVGNSTTIKTLRNNKSVIIPTTLSEPSLTKEANDYYTNLNETLVKLLKFNDSLKSSVIDATPEDHDTFNERVQQFIELENRLDALVVKQLSGDKLTAVQNQLLQAKKSRHDLLEIIEGFSNDLPNNNVKFTDDMNYSDYMADIALEPSIKQQHNDYVNDKNKLTSTPSFLPAMSHSTNVVPFVGLRRVQYAVNGKDLTDESARQVPSVVDFNQLDKPIKLTWA